MEMAMVGGDGSGYRPAPMYTSAPVVPAAQ